jgi:hypothetical protein
MIRLTGKVDEGNARHGSASETLPTALPLARTFVVIEYVSERRLQKTLHA